MEKRWCSSCGEAFEPRPQSPRQAYCNQTACQRERKRIWQRTKRRTDSDYRANQQLAQEAWRQGHADYWRAYRETHPDYAAANREQQRYRNARRTGQRNGIAKIDTSTSLLPASGIYRLTQIVPGLKGPSPILVVQITLIAAAEAEPS